MLVATVQEHQCNQHNLAPNSATRIPYTCATCKKDFDTQEALDLHYLSWLHIKKAKTKAPTAPNPVTETPYMCTTCKESFSSQEAVELHKLSLKHKRKAATQDQMGTRDIELSELVSLVPSTASSYGNGCFPPLLSAS